MFAWFWKAADSAMMKYFVGSTVVDHIIISFVLILYLCAYLLCILTSRLLQQWFVRDIEFNSLASERSSVNVDQCYIFLPLY